MGAWAQRRAVAPGFRSARRARTSHVANSIPPPRPPLLRAQSTAYNTLQQRLSAVPQLGILRLHISGSHGSAAPRKSGQAAKASAPPSAQIDFGALQQTFEAVQARYREHSRTAQEEHRLAASEDE